LHLLCRILTVILQAVHAFQHNNNNNKHESNKRSKKTYIWFLKMCGISLFTFIFAVGLWRFMINRHIDNFSFIFGLILWLGFVLWEIKIRTQRGYDDEQ
jgi:hypothetical protein